MGDWLRKLQQRASQTFGSGEATKDPVYDDYKARSVQLEKSLKAIFKQASAFWKGIGSNSASGSALGDAIKAFYPPDSRCFDAACKYSNVFTRLNENREQMDHIYQREVLDPIQAAINSLPQTKDKEDQRAGKLLIFDYYRQKVTKLRAQNKTDRKAVELLTRNEGKLFKAKEEYESLNRELILEFQNLDRKRQEMINRPYLQMMACQYNYFQAADEAMQELGNFLKHSELVDKSTLRYISGPTRPTSHSTPALPSQTDPGVRTRLQSSADPFVGGGGGGAIDFNSAAAQHAATLAGGHSGSVSEALGKPANASPLTMVSNPSGLDVPTVSLPHMLPWSTPANNNSSAPTPAPAPGIICKVTMLFPYTSDDANDLNLPAGAIVNVLEKIEENGWWKGEYQGRVGTFPSNFCAPC